MRSSFSFERILLYGIFAIIVVLSDPGRFVENKYR